MNKTLHIRIILVFLILLLGGALKAQWEEKPGLSDRLFFGGNFGLQIGTITNIERNVTAMSENLGLYQNYPNPFNPQTTIHYNLPNSSQVFLRIYDIHGKKVITLVDERQTSGEKSVQWNGRDWSGQPVSSGVYIYRLQADNFLRSRKMMLLR